METRPQVALHGPLMRMARFYLGDTLPEVNGAPDVYRLAKDLKDRSASVKKGEELLLTKLLFCILQIQGDQEETEQHQALCLLSAIVFAIIEDDDFFIPLDAAQAITRQQLELLAIEIQRHHDQTSMSLGATIGVWDLNISSSEDLLAIRARLPQVTPELDGVLTKLGVHLRQGESIFAGHTDPERRVRHKARLNQAYRRATYLLARLLTVAPAADHPVLRAHIVRREHRHVEIDALGAERIGEEEQERQTRKLLEWTEEEMGESLSDANKAELAKKLQAAAAEDVGQDSGSWFFNME